MPDLSPVLPLTPRSSWGNKVNQNIKELKFAHSSDFVSKKNSSGLFLQLSHKYKQNFDANKFKGNFDYAEFYEIGDQVYVDPATNYTSSGGGAISVSAGFWQCTATVANLTISDTFIAAGKQATYPRYCRPVGATVYPIIPMPALVTVSGSLSYADPITNPTGRYWQQVGGSSTTSGGTTATWG